MTCPFPSGVATSLHFHPTLQLEVTVLSVGQCGNTLKNGLTCEGLCTESPSSESHTLVHSWAQLSILALWFGAVMGSGASGLVFTKPHQAGFDFENHIQGHFRSRSTWTGFTQVQADLMFSDPCNDKKGAFVIWKNVIKQILFVQSQAQERIRSMFYFI